MLHTLGCGFNWQANNFGSTYSDAGIGTNVPGHANANTKGANTNLLNGIAEDCYGIAICISGGNTITAIRRQMVDLLIDPAAGVGNAGSSWSVLINNLYSNSPALGSAGGFGYWYYFPLYLKVGTAIGAAHQDLVATTQNLRVSIRVFGKPTRPELLRVGTKVQTLGATIATTIGTAVTPGSSVMGSWSASLGTLTSDKWWWQLGIGSDDVSMNARGYLFDIGVNATNKIIVAQNIPYIVLASSEQASMGAMGMVPPYYEVQSGENVYVRGASCGGAADTSISAVVYALGN